MLGVFLLPALTRSGHEYQDLLSPCNGMHVCTGETMVYTLIRKSFGRTESEPMSTPRQPPPKKKNKKNKQNNNNKKPTKQTTTTKNNNKTKQNKQKHNKKQKTNNNNNNSSNKTPKNKLYRKLRGPNPRHCITQDSEPNTLPTELFRPHYDAE